MSRRAEQVSNGKAGDSARVSRWSRYLRAVVAAATYRPERRYMRGNRQAGTPGAPAALPG